MKTTATLLTIALVSGAGVATAAVPQSRLGDLSLSGASRTASVAPRMTADFSVASLPGDDDAPEFIFRVPEGAEPVLYNRDWKGFWVLNYLGSFILQGAEDGRVQYLYFDGEDVYFPTPVLSFEAPTFIKGKKTESGITFPLPQCVYSYSDTENGEKVRHDYYIDYLYWDMDIGSYFTSDTAEVHSLDLTLLPDGSYEWENNEIVTGPNPDGGDDLRFMHRICGIVNQDEQWCGWADFLTRLNRFTTEPLTEAPAEAHTTLMTLSYGETERRVAVAFTDDEVWIQGFSEQNPTSWVKGKLEGNVATFGRQYTGIDDEQYYFGTFTGATSEMGWNEILEQPELQVTPLETAVFDYDPSEYRLTCRTDAMIAGGNDCDIAIEFLEKPVLQGQADTMVPHTPELISWYNYNPDSGYGRATFNIPAISQTGAAIEPGLLSWSIEIDGEYYVWDPSVHKRFPEAMTWVPYEFSDKDDVVISGDERKIYFRKNVEYYLAVRLRALDGDRYLVSDYALATTDKFNIEDWPSLNDKGDGVDASKAQETVSTVYYDLSGRMLRQAPEKGIYLECQVKADGSRKVRKAVK